MIAIPNVDKPKSCWECFNADCNHWGENGYDNSDDCPLIEIDQEDEEAVLFLLRMRKAMREGKNWREFLDEERRADEHNT